MASFPANQNFVENFGCSFLLEHYIFLVAVDGSQINRSYFDVPLKFSDVALNVMRLSLLYAAGNQRSFCLISQIHG